MISLRNILTNHLHDALQFLDGTNNTGLYQLEFGCEGCAELLHLPRIEPKVLDGGHGLGMIPLQAIFARSRCEEIGKVNAEL
jgi:hypothetical protein